MKKRKIIKKTGIVVLTAASAMNAFCTYIFVKAFGRKKENSIISRKRKRSPREEKQAAFMQEKKDWLDHLPFEELHIKSYDGLRLYGRLYLPQGSTRSDAHSKTMDVHRCVFFKQNNHHFMHPRIPFRWNRGFCPICSVLLKKQIYLLSCR